MQRIKSGRSAKGATPTSAQADAADQKAAEQHLRVHPQHATQPHGPAPTARDSSVDPAARPFFVDALLNTFHSGDESGEQLLAKLGLGPSRPAKATSYDVPVYGYINKNPRAQSKEPAGATRYWELVYMTVWAYNASCCHGTCGLSWCDSASCGMHQGDIEHVTINVEADEPHRVLSVYYSSHGLIEGVRINVNPDTGLPDGPVDCCPAWHMQFEDPGAPLPETDGTAMALAAEEKKALLAAGKPVPPTASRTAATTATAAAPATPTAGGKKQLNANNSHVVVYAANGGHGMYPNAGCIPRFCFFATEHMARGYRWTPYVVRVRREHEKGFRPEQDGWLYWKGMIGYDGIRAPSKQGWWLGEREPLTFAGRSNLNRCCLGHELASMCKGLPCVRPSADPAWCQKCCCACAAR